MRSSAFFFFHFSCTLGSQMIILAVKNTANNTGNSSRLEMRPSFSLPAGGQRSIMRACKQLTTAWDTFRLCAARRCTRARSYMQLRAWMNVRMWTPLHSCNLSSECANPRATNAVRIAWGVEIIPSSQRRLVLRKRTLTCTRYSGNKKGICFTRTSFLSWSLLCFMAMA